MSPSDLGLHLAGLALYPGLASMALFGVAAESALEWGLGWAAPERLAPALKRAAVPCAAVTLFAMLAAIQVPAPLSPIPGTEASLLVGAIALAAASWTGWAASPGRGQGALLVAQAAWLAALLVPAVIPLDLHPSTLGAIALPGFLPLKVLAAGTYVLAMPVVLHAVRGPGRARRPAASRPWRAPLWLPAGGLFAASFLPPPPGGLVGVGLFFAASAAAAGAALGLAVALNRAPDEIRATAYPTVLAVLAAATTAVGVVTAALLRGA